MHKIDRLARNRADDVEINLTITEAGAQAVSVTENIDETPSGMLLHGIMSSIAEFYSRNLATEIIKGMHQKAKNGGTSCRAPLGYLNLREFNDGREIRTIGSTPNARRSSKGVRGLRHRRVDTFAQLTEELEAERPPSAARPPKQTAKPIYDFAFHRLSTTRTTSGIVTAAASRNEGRTTHSSTSRRSTRSRPSSTPRATGRKATQAQPLPQRSTIFCDRCRAD